MVQRPDGSDLRLGFVWGKPLRVERRAEGGADYDEYVDSVHAAYVAALKGLFEKHKAQFGYGEGETLEIVSAKHAP